MLRASPLGILFALTLTIGCASDVENADTVSDVEFVGQGARLKIDHFLESDVVGFHFEVDRVRCNNRDRFKPFHYEANVDLVNGVFPGGIDLIGLDPLSDRSNHIGADFFIELDEGCYEVVAAPARKISGSFWLPSRECTAASGDARVRDRKTTEIVLLSQCEGESDGALDTIIVVNQPPQLEVVTQEKVGLQCVEREVCVRAIDPNDDPVDIDLIELGGADLFKIKAGKLKPVGFEQGARIWEQCFEVIGEELGTTQLRAVVHDLAIKKGQLVRMEELTDAPSHDLLNFPFHTIWEEAVCVNRRGKLESIDGGRTARRVNGCDFTSPQEYYCDDESEPDLVDFVCDKKGNVILSALYPQCDDD